MKASLMALIPAALGITLLFGSPLLNAAPPDKGSVEWCEARKKQLSELELEDNRKGNGKLNGTLDKTVDKVTGPLKDDPNEEYRKYCQ